MHWYGFVSFDAADFPFGIGRTVADCAGIGRLVGKPDGIRSCSLASGIATGASATGVRSDSSCRLTSSIDRVIVSVVTRCSMWRVR